MFANRIYEIVISDNPKTDTSSNTQQDPDDWASGDEPMTGAQRSYLKTLSEQAHQPDAYAENLTKATPRTGSMN